MSLPPAMEPPAPDEPGTGTVSGAEEAVLAEAEAVVEQVAEQTSPQAVASMDLLDNARRILFVHAHPDDETIANGATMARYAAEGAHVTLVTCTLGEEGEILVPELEHLAADQEDGLGQRRIGELATAMEALRVTDHRFLGGPGRYRDSGMAGTPSTQRREAFRQADVDEAAAHLVAVIREVRPQVLVTYEPNGGYGHPDHIQAHRVAMRAAELAADGSTGMGLGEPWPIPKIYWNVMPRSVARSAMEAMRAAGAESSFDAPPAPDAPDAAGRSMEDMSMVVDDAQVTAAVDAALYVEAKLAAMRAHATQITVDGPFFALSNNLGNHIWAVEYYRLVHGQPGPGTDADGRETDLFAGVA